jgi:fumarate reductase subunit D
MVERIIMDQLRYGVLFTIGGMNRRMFYALLVLALGAIVVGAAAVRHWRLAHTRLAVVVVLELASVAMFLTAARAFGAMSSDTVELSLLSVSAYYYVVVGLSHILDGRASVAATARPRLSARAPTFVQWAGRVPNDSSLKEVDHFAPRRMPPELIRSTEKRDSCGITTPEPVSRKNDCQRRASSFQRWRATSGEAAYAWRASGIAPFIGTIGRQPGSIPRACRSTPPRC